MPGGSFEHTKLSVAVSFILVQFNVADKSFSVRFVSHAAYCFDI